MTTEIQQGSSLWKDAWLRLSRNRAATAGLAFLVLVVITCVFLPMTGLLPDPDASNLNEQNLGMSGKHPLGTDQVGRDLFSRVVYGGRISLIVGLVTTIVSMTVGVTWGAIAGYAGGRLDSFMMRVVDFLFALPFLVVIILLGVILGSHTETLTDWVAELVHSREKNMEAYNSLRSKIAPVISLIPVLIAIASLSWLTVSRIVRAQVQSVKNLDYIEAARSLGLGHFRILFRHILPNTMGPIIVYTTLTIPGIMLFEATLSFLGLGVKPPYSSWGVLIQEGANYMMTDPRLLLWPALVFSATLLSLNFLGDGLRDALDPRSAKD